MTAKQFNTRLKSLFKERKQAITTWAHQYLGVKFCNRALMISLNQ